MLLTALIAVYPLQSQAELIIVGARSDEKSDWIRHWSGISHDETVTCLELQNIAWSLKSRGMVRDAVVFPLSLFDEIQILYKPENTKTRTRKLLEAYQKFSQQSKEGIKGLVSDFKIVTELFPQVCVETLQGTVGREDQGPIQTNQVTTFIADHEPAGLLIREYPKISLRDRIHWGLPPDPGANLRIRDIIRYGDQLELEFKLREASKDFKGRLLTPVISTTYPNIGLELSGRYRRHDSDFLWNKTTEASARISEKDLSALLRIYHGYNGAYLALGGRVAQQDFTNSDDFPDDDWEQNDGITTELITQASWNDAQRDYDPEKLFLAGFGGTASFRLSSQKLGSPVSYKIAEARTRKTQLLFDNFYWDIEMNALISSGLPHVLQPGIGGKNTVRGHKTYMSADRMVCLQQTLRKSFYWKHSIIFTPSVIFDIGLASQKNLAKKRRNGHLEGVGGGVRWDFPALNGFKMFEITVTKAFNFEDNFRIDLSTKFEF
ncbi:MAG: hypothetical protein GX811_11295 [Lentisphaerae bacterium]|nr:hypothetical protein [Lentisphaerota bacterium]